MNQLRKVIQNFSGNAALDLVDPSLFTSSTAVTQTSKSSILLDSRCFTETPINANRCAAVITKALWLMQREDEVFTSTEKQELFFSSTRLFQSNSAHLRRLVHLFIRTLEPPVDVAFVVTSSLTKDMASSDSLFRSNALRTIVRMVDPQQAQQLERYLKSAVVSKNPILTSTAILCSMRLTSICPEMVRRWSNEVSECVHSQNPMVQFHALSLLHELKKQDKLALHRIIVTLTAKMTKSPLTDCALIRYAQDLLGGSTDSPLDSSLVDFLEASIQHQSEFVRFEAAKAIVRLILSNPRFADQSRSPLKIDQALSTLQILLANPRDVVRFGAIRIMNALSQRRPDLLRHSLDDIEPLLNDPCRSVVVFALVTILKAGANDNIDKFISQISAVIVDLSESQRISTVDALLQMCTHHKEKAKTVAAFLAKELRGEGGTESKAAMVQALSTLAKDIPAVHDDAIAHLCDFIEDCEYVGISSYILAFLAEEVPKTPHPIRYLRHIYNRLILEKPAVRAAAVDSLIRIALAVPEVQKDVSILLGSTFGLDSEDEVRERVVSGLLELDDRSTEAETDDEELNSVSLEAFTLALSAHVEREEDIPFPINRVPSEAAYLEMKRKGGQQEKERPEAQKEEKVSETLSDAVRMLLPEGIELGRLCHQSQPQYLTEQESEYVVLVVKEFWENAEYMSFQVTIRNTLEDSIIEDVVLQLGPHPDFTILGETKILSLSCNESGNLVVLLKKKQGICEGSFPAQLSYTVRDKDVQYSDDAMMENIEVTVGDYIYPLREKLDDFTRRWSDATFEKFLNLHYGQIRNGLAGGKERVLQTLNLHVLDEQSFSNRLEFKLMGRLVGGEALLVDVKLADNPAHGLLGKLRLKSNDEKLLDKLSLIL